MARRAIQFYEDPEAYKKYLEKQAETMRAKRRAEKENDGKGSDGLTLDRKQILIRAIKVATEEEIEALHELIADSDLEGIQASIEERTASNGSAPAEQLEAA